MENHLLKLLIVEDETNIRNLLKMMLDWDKIGVRIIGEASTGTEALHLMEEEIPDIVLTDIEMPYIDGLTLSERILERYNDVTIIILTAHDHFAYAQQALRMGVTNYLLKPLDKGKLEGAIEEAVRQIRDRRTLLRDMKASYKFIQSNVNSFRDRLMSELIHNGYTEGMEDILKMIGVNLALHGQYTLALMNIADNGKESFASEKYLMLNNCRAYVEEHYAKKERLFIFVDGLDYLALISNDDEADLPGICRRITDVLGEGLDCRIYCGVSDPCSGADYLQYAYAQAQDALRLSFIAGEEVVYSGMGRSLPEADVKDFEGRMRDLLLFVKSGMSDSAVDVANGLLERAVSSRGGDLNNARILVFRVLSKAVEALSGQNIPWITLVSQIAPSYTQLLNEETFPEVAKLLSEQIRMLCALAQNSQQQISNETVSKIIRDLEDSYKETEISLAFMARKYAVNSSYLSRIFKGYTGKSFSEYLIDLRIQKAKSILERDDMKAYQIAQLIGISDPNYFTKCFKKVTGISFQAYKAEQLKKQQLGK